MSNVLVLGAAGMAGHVVATYLREQNHIVSTLSAKNKLDDETIILDVTDQAKLNDFLSHNDFDVVVNCIGVLVKESDARQDLASYLNAYLPHYLENFYKISTTKLIHLSTDCVFSGKNAPYRERSLYDGELFYDRSKALGEVINDKDLTFRMSIIGPDMQPAGSGLFNWFVHQQGEISGFKTAIWNGVTTIILAQAIHSAIEQNLVGLYHLVPKESISKYDLLSLFRDAFHRNNITIHPSKAIVQDKTLLNTRTDFDFEVTDYTEMVRGMRDWIDNHGSIYPHYS